MTGGGNDGDIDKRLAALGEKQGDLPKVARRPLDKSKVDIEADAKAKTFNWLTLLAAGTYAGFVALACVYLLIRGLWCGENVWAEFLDLGKIMVLPIMALVAGHFYGSRSR